MLLLARLSEKAIIKYSCSKLSRGSTGPVPQQLRVQRCDPGKVCKTKTRNVLINDIGWRQVNYAYCGAPEEQGSMMTNRYNSFNGFFNRIRLIGRTIFGNFLR